MKLNRKRIAVTLLALILMSTAIFQISYGEAGVSNINSITTHNKLENAIVVYVDSNVAMVNNQQKQIDPENDMIAPFVESGRSLVPIRFIAESLGADVSWDKGSKAAVIELGNKKIIIPNGSSEMVVNNEKVNLDVPAVIKDKRTFVPLRAISEALGKEVFYDRGLIIISDIENILDLEKDKTLLNQLIDDINDLPAVGTKENLKKIVEQTNWGRSYTYKTMRNSVQKEAMVDDTASEAAASEASSDSSDQSADYSTTNVQVEGVDEADIVKTDGKYLYQVSDNQVVITRVYPADEMKVIQTIKFDEVSSFWPNELYIDDTYMVVLGDAYSNENPIYLEKKMACYPYMPSSTVKAYIYNIQDKNNIKLVREVEIEGSYVTSRKIGSALYLISNAHIGYDVINDENVPTAPVYRDSAVSKDFKCVPYEEIKYIPPIIYPQYLVVASLDLDTDDEVALGTYLGASSNVYVSKENIYVAVNMSHYSIMPFTVMEDEATVEFNRDEYEPNTKIYKFSMDEGKTTYLTKGEVPGTILNQFSMDEHKKSFRIATTRDTYAKNKYVSTNNLYILDENMKMTGKIEDIAPEERIYSVRFMGDRGYMVTFKNVDPLFVLDLEDPSNPFILGKLKIPGYSDYLHPYDENHLIGFGKDTIEVPSKDWQGRVVSTNAYYMGIKVALFDVSDVSNPIEKHKIIIGDRGTESELLRDHKALLFDKQRNLLGFPIMVSEVKGAKIDKEHGYPNYGEPVFQGAHVYEITPENGFKLKGEVSHITKEDELKSGYYYSDESAIRRLLYIGNYLYGVSDEKISAHDIDTIKEKNSITIK